MTAPDWFYFVVAVLLYVVVYYAVDYALRPKPLPDPDWFWGGDYHEGQWTETKPEQTDQQQSKPTSGAG